MKVLIAEDEMHMSKIIAMYFEKEGYEIYVAKDGEEALECLYSTVIDLVILDWMMPKVSGIEVCKEMRRLQHPAKILMLTAKSEVEDEIVGLTHGADDYIRKPFDPKILLLRAKKLIGNQEELSCNGLRVDLQTNKVYLQGAPIVLSKKELELLQCFMQNKNKILSREQLLDRVWGLDYYGDDRTVDTHIRRLRSKIGEEFIITHRGIGYSMEEKNE